MSKELSKTEQNLINAFNRVGVICKLVNMSNEAEGGFSLAGIVVAADQLINAERDIKNGLTAYLKKNKPEMYDQLKKDMAEKGIDIDNA